MLIERFQMLVASQRGKLFATAFRLLQNREDAEDAVQEALLRLWDRRLELESVICPDAFVMQMVKNICFDLLRARRVVVTAVGDLPAITSEGDSPCGLMEWRDMGDVIRRIIEGLPTLQQIIIRMRDVEGYELQEIAAITQSEVAAVSVNLSRARKKVREVLSKIMFYGTE
jgi:RNA polymerase sigma-70 factor (ECF subfamily)